MDARKWLHEEDDGISVYSTDDEVLGGDDHVALVTPTVKTRTEPLRDM
jgi:hypothetical protein